jgi:hypothetical protein
MTLNPSKGRCCVDWVSSVLVVFNSIFVHKAHDHSLRGGAFVL